MKPKIKTHKDIDPRLAKAMRAVRKLFVEHPSRFRGTEPNIKRVSECGCVIAHVAFRLGEPNYGITAFCKSFPASAPAIQGMFNYTASEENVKNVIKRIDNFLKTNT